METKWLHGLNFDANGAFVPENSAVSTASDSAPCFERLLGVPSELLTNAVRRPTEATLLHEIPCLAMEMDMLVEYLGDQLHDRAKLSCAVKTNDSACATMDTTLLALEQQALQMVDKNVAMLLKRFQRCVETLGDLRYPLAQCIEHHLDIADQRESSYACDTTASATSEDLMDVETKLLERLRLLQEPECDIPWSAGSVAPTPRQQQLVCWPVASSSEESKQSHRSDGMMLGLGSSFVSTLTSPLYSASSSSDTTHLSEVSPSPVFTANADPRDGIASIVRREELGDDHEDEEAPVATQMLRQESSSDESITTSEVRSQSIY